MSTDMNDKERTIYTIGHSNIELADFIDLLQRHHIGFLVDVRSSPYSKYARQFEKKYILHAVEAAGIKYLFAGKEMGGQPKSPEFYDEDGYVLYSRIAESQPFIDRITDIEEKIESNRIALMCSEENPNECHRRLLIGRVFHEKGIEVHHIRKDGIIVTEDELRAEEDKKSDKQMSLFGNREEKEWKSTQ